MGRQDLVGLEGTMSYGENGLPDKGPGNMGVNPGYSQAGEERKEGFPARRQSREIWGSCLPGGRLITLGSL